MKKLCSKEIYVILFNPVFQIIMFLNFCLTITSKSPKWLPCPICSKNNISFWLLPVLFFLPEMLTDHPDNQGITT